MRYFIVAGEASGDNLGGPLISELKKLDIQANFRFWGGDQMELSAGQPPLKHYKELAFMGLVEVIKNLPTIYKNFDLVKSQITAFNPDVVILIDYPGFNLRLAKWLKNQGYKVIYYVSPTVWAWHKSRVYQIEKYIDLMICILPFEVDFYKDYKVNAVYHGSPVLDNIRNFNPNQNFKHLHNISKPIIAIIPGSRKQEIQNLLPDMIKAAEAFSDEYEICISKAKHLDLALYNKALKNSKCDYHLIEDDYHNLLHYASLSIVTSGTASLETAIHGTPQVVCYKMNALSYAIAVRLVKLDYISLVNLIANEGLVTELIQENCTSENIIKEIMVLKNSSKNLYQKFYAKLGEEGSSKRIAQSIYSVVG
jgi:lipid-A-disaccharide synthase